MGNSENKYNKWVFTLLEGGEFNSLPSSMEMGEALEKISDKFVFQKEVCPSTGREHFQGCFITRIRKRHKTVVYDLSVDLQIEITQLTIDRMQGTWDQAVEYCTKNETASSDPYKSKLLKEEDEKKYLGKDISIFKEGGFFPWQSSLNDIIFKDNTFEISNTNGREVIWCEDLEGGVGKSLYTKYLCFNNAQITKLAFGSGSQMRASVVEEGSKKCYIIDIPRQLCNDDHMNNFYSVVEDLKNGFIKSSMYGKPKTLFMEPPIVIIFANFKCPTEKLSIDRWQIYGIIDNELQPIQRFIY